MSWSDAYVRASSQMRTRRLHQQPAPLSGASATSQAAFRRGAAGPLVIYGFRVVQIHLRCFRTSGLTQVSGGCPFKTLLTLLTAICPMAIRVWVVADAIWGTTTTLSN